MKEQLLIKKDNKRNNIGDYLITMLRKLFNISGRLEIKFNGNKKELYNNGKLVCEFNLDKSRESDSYILNIYVLDYSYCYMIDYQNDLIRVSLHNKNYKKDNRKYYITTLEDSVLVEVLEDNRKLELELDRDKINKKKLIYVVDKLSPADNIERIYFLLEDAIENCENYRIRKAIVLDTAYPQDKITDMIVMRNGILETFLITVETEDKKYIVKKEYGNYTISITNKTLDSFLDTYIDLRNNDISFVKKLERKKK